MHPAPSVIVFTTLSGLGFGMLFWLGLGFPPVTGWTAFFMFVLAYLLAVGGLVASTTHLGNPQRAWRAFTQWRSSWLSREGCCAVGALLIMALYGIGAVFAGQHWLLFGVIGAALSVATVFTTAMIYTQLKTVPRWNQPGTPALFLALSLGGGALLAGQVPAAIVLLLLAGGAQVWVWHKGDRRFAEAGSNIETATGLGRIGKVRLFEPPHTGTNYLMKEMVHEVGRKHAQKLRIIALSCMCILPVLLLIVFPAGHFVAALAVLVHLAGVLASRWLFFAQAEHVVGLYYGKRSPKAA